MKPHLKASVASVAAISTRTADSYQNFNQALGIGTQNAMSGSTYGFNPITRNRTLLEYAYRGSWIVRAAIKTIADDMTREGIDITSDIPPDEIDKLEKRWDMLQIWQAFNEALCWARLYGGSIMVYLIDGQDMSTPLRIETIGKNQFKGFAVLDRWMVEPPLGDLIKEFGPNLGKPKFYNIIGDSLKLPRQKVHHSRVIRFDGDDIPYYQRLAENGWGLSILEPLFDRLIQFDSATTGAAQLTNKAHLRTLKVKKLREIIAMGGQAYASLLSQISQMRLFQQSEGITLLDAEDDFEVHPYTFTGLADMIQQFSSQLSGSLGIPVTRLFGVSPGGLNATGQSDLQTYYDKIKQLQSDNLKTDIIKTLNVLHMSTLSKIPGQDLNFTFRTLWQIDASAKAEIASKNATTIGGMFTAGITSRETALKELKQQSDETGVFTNITDEEIHEAKNDPPVGQQLQPPGADPQSGQPPRPEEAQGSPGAAGAGANEAGAGQPRQAQPAPDNLAHLKGLKSVPESGQTPLALKPEHAAKLLTLVK